MLARLYISNYAIIDELEMEISPRLNTITGETGAGKSILLGALALILGKRADTSVLYRKDKKCIVEGSFDIRNYELKDFFLQHDLDYESVSIIRREINLSGKSRAFINDTPVTLEVLRELANQLVDIHSQHETLDLSSSKFQIKVIDALASNDALLNKYRDDFNNYRKTAAHLKELEENNFQANTDRDYIQFQLDELERAGLEAIDQQSLETELNSLNHAEDIKRNLLSAVYLLDGDEEAIGGRIREVITLLKQIQSYKPELKEFIQRLDSTLIEMKDVYSDLENEEQKTHFDEGRIEEISDILNEVYRLEHKHQLQSVEELGVLKEKLDQQIQQIDIDTGRIDELKVSLEQQETALWAMAQEISQRRKDSMPLLEEKVNELLEEVGMPAARFLVHQSPLEHPGPHGLDEIRFLFTANRGSEPLDLKKAASGGELSRLMLCIKSLLARSTALPSLIFDEIDTGVSGEIARKVGIILKKLGKQHQVVAITHLPQIASQGDRHFYVYKESDTDNTFTRIRTLNNEDRLLEIAKMLSGEKPTEAAMANARELLEG